MTQLNIDVILSILYQTHTPMVCISIWRKDFLTPTEYLQWIQLANVLLGRVIYFHWTDNRKTIDGHNLVLNPCCMHAQGNYEHSLQNCAQYQVSTKEGVSKVPVVDISQEKNCKSLLW